MFVAESATAAAADKLIAAARRNIAADRKRLAMTLTLGIIFVGDGKE